MSAAKNAHTAVPHVTFNTFTMKYAMCTIVQLGEKLYNNYCRRNRNIVKKDWTFGIQFFYVNKC